MNREGVQMEHLACITGQYHDKVNISLEPSYDISRHFSQAHGGLRQNHEFGSIPGLQTSQIPSVDNLIYTMQDCNDCSHLVRAKQLHIHLHGLGLEIHQLLGSQLVSMHVSCGNIPYAEQIFNKLLYQDVYVWTALLQGYLELGDHARTLDLLPVMQATRVSPNKSAFLALLKASTRLRCVQKGQAIHTEIAKQGLDEDAFVGNTVLDFYAKCGLLVEAWQVFCMLPDQDVVSWNTLVAGYAEHGLNEDAWNSLQQMRQQGILPNGVTYACSLKACGFARDLDKAHELHTAIIIEGFEEDVFVSSSLVNLYVRCKSHTEAQRVLDGLHDRNIVTWTALVAGYAEDGLAEEAMECLQQMESEGILPNAYTLVCALKACSEAGDLLHGQEVHAAVVVEGLEGNIFVGSALVDMYIQCDVFAEAQEVFDALATRDVALWNVMIGGYAEHGRAHEAFDCLGRMQRDGVPFNAASFINVVKSCGCASRDAIFIIHSSLFKYGFEEDPSAGSSLVDAYAKAGFLTEAWEVFDKLEERCVVTWNSLIGGHAELGFSYEALQCLEEMITKGLSPNAVTFLCSLKACGSLRAIEWGYHAHSWIVKLGFEQDAYVRNSLVDMYAKCACLEEARKEFETHESPNLVSYAALVVGHIECGLTEQALEYVERLELEGILVNGATYACLLKACGILGKGRKLHTVIVKDGLEGDPLVVQSLLSLYANGGLIKEAQEVFDESSVQDVILWSLLIEGYTDQGLPMEALACWDQMQAEGVDPDTVAFVSILKACTCVGAIKKGQRLHCQIVLEGFEDDHFIVNTLVDLYSKYGFHAEAHGLLAELVLLDRVSWNLMIRSCCERGKSERALTVFWKMQEQGILPDSATFTNIFTACGDAAAVEAGKRFHTQLCAAQKLEASDPVVTAALIDMYGKCGSVARAQEVFDGMLVRDVVAWTALMSSYSRHCESSSVILMLHRMIEERAEPTDITFLSLLSMCSHMGLVEEGRQYFLAMSKEYYIMPTVVHHNCFLTLLGRAGQVEEALLMVEWMPFRPNSTTWTSLLSACQMWVNVGLTKESLDAVGIVDLADASVLVMMSNIFADV